MCALKHKRRTHNTNKKLTYNLIRWRAASHPTLQFALGVLDSMLRGVRCDDRWAWWEEVRKREQSREMKNKKEDRYLKMLTNTKLSDINADAAHSFIQSKHSEHPCML